MKGKTNTFYPFDARHSGIHAYVVPPFLCEKRNDLAYQVSWPSIGSVDVADARQFAEAIIKACDWLDAEKEADNARPVE